MTGLLFDHLEEVRAGAKKTLRLKREPSVYQKAVTDAFAAGVRAIMVGAVPGSGKTTLLEMLAETILDLGVLSGQPGVFLAYNTPIVKTLRKVIPAVFDVRSVNSLGHLICTTNQPGLKFEPRKYEDLARDIVREAGIPSPAARKELLDRLQSTLNLHNGHALGLDLSLPDWVEALLAVDAPIYGAEEKLHQLVHRTLRHGLKMMRDDGVMSFADQTLAPCVFGWELPTKYRVLLIDELQDISKAHLQLLKASTDEQSRIVGVGDPYQSINAFNGADIDSMTRFQEWFGAVSMPLSISYRLPSRHAALAAPLCPGLEAREGAPLGTLEDITGDELLQMARPGDLVLCRLNAPTVAWCYDLIRQGTPAIVRGRDLSKSLVAFARDAATWNGQKSERDQVRDDLDLTDFGERLNGLAESLAQAARRQAERTGKDADARLAGIADKVGALMLVLEQSGAGTLGQLVAAIRGLFAGDPENSVTLSTVHRAKGLEAARVFIIHPELIPYPHAKTELALRGEACVQLVAYSRATQALYFVDAPRTHIPEHLRGVA